jgi:hypothetical protein
LFEHYTYSFGALHIRRTPAAHGLRVPCAVVKGKGLAGVILPTAVTRKARKFRLLAEDDEDGESWSETVAPAACRTTAK